MNKHRRITVVVYDRLRTFEYAIVAEVFALKRPNLGVRWYDYTIVKADRRPARGYGGVAITGGRPLSTLTGACTIVVPGWRDPAERPPPRLLAALRTAAQRGARFLSICTGSFVLAWAGLLDGRRATTHWLHAEAFKRMFPAVNFQDDVLYVDDGPFTTSAGSAAGIDACLDVVRRDHGARVANLVARRMVVSPHREGGQAQYVEAPVSVSPLRRRGIGPVLDWARSRLNQRIQVRELAAHAAMSERTFLRRFTSAMGIAPRAWLERERMSRARELLESSSLSLDEVATDCGYDSLETFRVVFRRVIGVPPGAFRARFGGRRATD